MSKLQEYIQKYADLYTGKKSVYFGGEKSKINFSGSQGIKHLTKHIQRVIKLKQRAVSVLDYGCGAADHLYTKNELLNNKTTFEYYRGMLQCYYLYDPCNPVYNVKPTVGSQFDITICSDVMEHVPEECVDEVLQEISSYTKPDGIVMFTISGNPGFLSFENGENLHVTQKSLNWWTEKISKNINRTILLVYKQSDKTFVMVGNSREFKFG